MNLSEEEKLRLRKERFGTMNDDDKKKQRKERFGIATDNDITKFSVIFKLHSPKKNGLRLMSLMVFLFFFKAKSLVEKEKKKKRAERFGASKHPRNSKKGKIEKESAKALEGLNQVFFVCFFVLFLFVFCFFFCFFFFVFFCLFFLRKIEKILMTNRDQNADILEERKKRFGI